MDLVKILAGYLVREAPGHIARAKSGDLLQQLISLPNIKEWDQLIEESKRYEEELRQAGEYFYQGGGSIFMDYKILKDAVIPKGGMRKVAARFRDDMTKDELRQTAEAIINEWLSSTGKERKI